MGYCRDFVGVILDAGLFQTVVSFDRDRLVIPSVLGLPFGGDMGG